MTLMVYTRCIFFLVFFFFSSRRRHTRCSRDWSSDVCSSDLDDALFAAARLLRYVADQGGPLSRLLADLPVTVATPELRVDCADDRKFEIVQRAAKHFASKYPVSTLDGVRITFAQGWGLLRASRSEERRVGKECRSRWSPYH